MSTGARQQQERGGSRKPSFLDDYVGVHQRIERLYEKYPNARIVTEMLPAPADMVCFKAMIYRTPDSAEPDATGHAIAKLSIAESTLEKTETAAVGRGIAFLGFEVKEGIASREEIENARRAEQCEQTAKQPAKLAAVADTKAAQPSLLLNPILDLELALEPYGKPQKALRDKLEEVTGKREPVNLTDAEQKQYKDWLEKLLAKKKAESAG